MIAPKFFHDESRVRVLVDGGLEETTRIYNHFKSRGDFLIVSVEINFLTQTSMIMIDTDAVSDYYVYNEIMDEIMKFLQDGKSTSKD